MRISLPKVLPFIITADHTPRPALLESDRLRQHFLPPPKQLELNFDAPAPTPADLTMAHTGEL
jgi:hypothetical protein